MYVARDKCGDLCVYAELPQKDKRYECWRPDGVSTDWFILDSILFPEVKWEDEEPTEVELVKKEIV